MVSDRTAKANKRTLQEKINNYNYSHLQHNSLLSGHVIKNESAGIGRKLVSMVMRMFSLFIFYLFI